ncbi:MAG TPA: EAL domain-containing protein [Kineosporiaceae bacterium]|nr:EAL domain-containing protein [Kineosporiaceae bacterium]
MSRFGREISVGFGIIGLLLSVIYALQLNVTTNSICTGVVALGSVVCLIVGPILHKPIPALPWRLLAGASIVFLGGVVIRPWAVLQDGWARWSADSFSLVGYALLVASLIALNRARGPLERHALADGAIVCLGAGLVVAVVFVLPAMDITTRPRIMSFVQGLYPLIDILLLLLLLNLAFTTASRLPSYRAFVIGMVALQVGDFGYGWIGARGQLTGSPLLDLPFLVAYTFFGVAAIHPSMAWISKAVPNADQPWSVMRMALIIPALIAPGVAAFFIRIDDQHSLILLGVVIIALVLTLLFRAVAAVHSLDRMQETFRFQARHDALTGLANRAELMDKVARMQSARRRQDPSVWVLFLDLDGFKFINDSWGHETGDQLLVEVAARLQLITRSTATVGRVGGDEFVISGLLTREQAIELAVNVQATLRNPIEIEGLDLIVTTSIGMAEATMGENAEGLLRDADAAMYRAKGAGRDGYMIFDDSMRQSVRDRVEIELALRHAVARGQLWIAYQPIVNLETEFVAGCEALLRWNHPVRGEISPKEFISVAEETGMIIGIGAWVLQESVYQLSRWQRAGVVSPDFFMSVNASTRQLRDHQLTKLTAEVLAETGVNASRLVVEITESVMLEQSDLVTDVLTGLRDLGVRLSVDDFGTGYSSLSYLNRYPVTGVKVDRAFVDGLGDVPGDEAIVRAVTAMASALNLGVVAEGVETARQRDILCELGIEHGQGWLWGRAEPPETFELLWGPPTQKELQAKEMERAAARPPVRLVTPLPRGLAEAVAEATASSQTEEANS